VNETPNELESEIKLFKSLFLKLALVIFLAIWGYFMYHNEDKDQGNQSDKIKAFRDGRDLACKVGGKTFIANNSTWDIKDNILIFGNRSVPIVYCSVIEPFGENK